MGMSKGSGGHGRAETPLDREHREGLVSGDMHFLFHIMRDLEPHRYFLGNRLMQNQIIASRAELHGRTRFEAVKWLCAALPTGSAPPSTR